MMLLRIQALAFEVKMRYCELEIWRFLLITIARIDKI